MKKSNLKVFSNRARSRRELPYLSADKYGRIYISAKALELMNITRVPIHLYLAYDSVNKRIGLARPDVVRLPDVNPFRFNGKRVYASCKLFLETYNIKPTGKGQRYFYSGREDGWYTFQLEGFYAPDDKYK